MSIVEWSNYIILVLPFTVFILVKACYRKYLCWIGINEFLKHFSLVNSTKQKCAETVLFMASTRVLFHQVFETNWNHWKTYFPCAFSQWTLIRFFPFVFMVMLLCLLFIRISCVSYFIMILTSIKMLLFRLIIY